MSRWLALSRTSSSNGKSHSNKTITVCTSFKVLVTFSKPIIQLMSSSSTASRNGWVLVRLAILSTVSTAILLLSLNASVPTRVQWFLKSITLKKFPGSCRSLYLSKHLTCVSRTYSQLQPTNLTYFSLLISRQVVGSLTCPSTSLVPPGLIPNLSLSRYSPCSSPGKLSEPSMSKHLTCVSRTYSQPQPVEILSNKHKTMSSGNQLTSHFHQMTLQPTCQKDETKTHCLNQNIQVLRCPWLYTSSIPA